MDAQVLFGSVGVVTASGVVRPEESDFAMPARETEQAWRLLGIRTRSVMKTQHEATKKMSHVVALIVQHMQAALVV